MLATSGAMTEQQDQRGSSVDEKALKRKHSESSDVSDEFRPPEIETKKQYRYSASPSDQDDLGLLQDVHSSSESPESKIKTPLVRNESGTSTSEIESSDSRTGSPVEQSTSLWSENTLNSLQITSMTSNLLSGVEMLNLILSSMGPFHLTTIEGELMYQMPDHILNKVDNCLKMLNVTTSPLEKLDVYDIEEIDPSHAYRLMFDQSNSMPKGKNRTLVRNMAAWIPHPTDFNLTQRFETWFKQMFYIHGHRFTQQLVNICVFKKDHQIYESMFENLFEEFAGMCGLLCLKQGPGVAATIGSTKVTSVADIIFPCFTDSDEDSLNILSVCEIKRDYSPFDFGTPKKTRFQERRNMKREKTVKHLNDKVVGQHGGELLLNMINMAEKKRADIYSLVGMIVQRTNVTFTHFTCSDDELETIRSGRRPKRSLEIAYSESYNYLRKDDRSQLMRVLLALGIIQTIPFK